MAMDRKGQLGGGRRVIAGLVQSGYACHRGHHLSDLHIDIDSGTGADAGLP
jgi:hypothetical protein